MNRPFTTLVLGAGTSMPYDYPSGAELVGLIIEDIEKRGDGSLERELLQALKDRSPESIDSFLNEFSQFDEIAKGIIAEILFERENPDHPRPKEDFYNYLFNNIPIEKYGAYKIITFNYDRSLEFYFARFLRPSCKEIPPLKKLAALEVEHIHGRLWALDEHDAGAPQMPRDQQAYVYGARRTQRFPSHVSGVDRGLERHLDRQFLAQQSRFIAFHAKNNFRTVYQNNTVNERAKGFLENSARVFFLGFGYHDLNMKLLGLSWEKDEGRLIAGTCHNVSSVALEKLRKRYPVVEFYDRTAYRLFQDCFDLTDPEIRTQHSKGRPG
jgi:hypothetical protein